MVDGSARPNWQSLLETMALVVIAGAIGWQAVTGTKASAPVTNSPGGRTPRPPMPEAPVPSEPISVEGAQLMGASTAEGTLIVYSDYQCPFCGRYERDTFPELKSRYVDSGELRVAFREYPLSMHPLAQKAAEAALCAARQNRFWEMHSQLFLHQPKLDEADLLSYASAVGLDATAFSRCLSGEATAAVKADVASGDELRVTGTPTFLLGSTLGDGRVKVLKRWTGALSSGQVESMIDAGLKGVRPKIPAAK